jgi:hypothetical protein
MANLLAADVGPIDEPVKAHYHQHSQLIALSFQNRSPSFNAIQAHPITLNEIKIPIPTALGHQTRPATNPAIRPKTDPQPILIFFSKGSGSGAKTISGVGSVFIAL